MLHSAAASCDRSLMPSNRPSSSKATALTMRPSSRASRTRSVRYSSPVAADGVERRDPAAQPGGVEGVQPGVDLVAGQLLGRRRRAPRRSARPSRTRCARRARARPGRRRRRWPARSRRRPARRASRIGLEVGAGDQRHVAGQDEDLGRLVGRRRRARRATASPVPRGSSWRAKTARSAKTSMSAATAGEKTTIGRPPAAPSGGARPGVEDVGQHRPPAQRVEDLGRRGPHPGAEAGRQHDGDRAGPQRGRDLGGSRGAAPSGDGRRSGGRARADRGPARSGQQSSVGRGIVGVARRGCQPTPGDDLDLDPGALRQGGDPDRRAGRRRIGHEPAVDRR